ncbi:RNA-directed DNA polymerase, eukaryota [Tanacetum coccineum]
MAHSSLNFSFRRLPRGGAEDMQYQDLYSYTSEVLLPNMSDRWAWSLSASGDFSVSSTRSYIDAVSLPKSDVPTRWVKLVPIKVNIIAWKINLDGLPTRLNLSSRGVDIPSILCPVCNEDKLTFGDKSLDLSTFKLSRLFFSLLSSGSSSCCRSYGAQ